MGQQRFPSLFRCSINPIYQIAILKNHRIRQIADVDAMITEHLSQESDYPVSLHFPKGAYLKGLVCVKGDVTKTSFVIECPGKNLIQLEIAMKNICQRGQLMGWSTFYYYNHATQS